MYVCAYIDLLKGVASVCINRLWTGVLAKGRRKLRDETETLLMHHWKIMGVNGWLLGFMLFMRQKHELHSAEQILRQRSPH